jgi:hypothetical protein
MRKLIEGIRYDAEFIRDHELQPRWYKILKVIILMGLIIGSFLLFDTAKTLSFFGCFFGLALIIHMIYRIKTEKFTQSWLDFQVEEVDGQLSYQRIGPYYYLAVATSALIAFVISYWLVD